PVADDQLPLAPADGDHGVDGLPPRLQGGVHRLAVDDAGGRRFHRAELDAGVDGARFVQGLTHGVDHPAQQLLPYGNRHDAPRAAHFVALVNVLVGTQNYGAYVVFGQVQGHGVDAVGELQQFAGHARFQAVDAGDTVGQLDDGAHIFHLQLALIGLDLLLDYG